MIRIKYYKDEKGKIIKVEYIKDDKITDITSVCKDMKTVKEVEVKLTELKMDINPVK